MVSEERRTELLEADPARMKVAELRSALSELGVEQPTNSNKKQAYVDLFENWQKEEKKVVGKRKNVASPTKVLSAAKVAKKTTESGVETTVVQTTVTTVERRAKPVETTGKSVFAETEAPLTPSRRSTRSTTPPRERRATTPPRERAVHNKVDAVLSQAVELTPNTKFESYLTRRRATGQPLSATLREVPAEPLSVDLKNDGTTAKLVGDTGIADSEVLHKSNALQFLALAIVFSLWVFLFAHVGLSLYKTHEVQVWEHIATVLNAFAGNHTEAVVPVTTPSSNTV